MQELKDKRIPAKWVLIDDGWLDADYKKQVLKGLDADADKFPDGLGACIREIKQDYDVKQVGVWHAVMGYWNGLEKDSSAGRKLRDESRTLEDGRIVPDTEPGRAFAFYDTWHSYLKTAVMWILSRSTVRVQFPYFMPAERSTAELRPEFKRV